MGRDAISTQTPIIIAAMFGLFLSQVRSGASSILDDCGSMEIFASHAEMMYDEVQRDCTFRKRELGLASEAWRARVLPTEDWTQLGDGKGSVMVCSSATLWSRHSPCLCSGSYQS